MTSPAPAPPAVSALFADLFDDAGLFPPASLPMDEAFDAHRVARGGAFHWMLARFVCPISRVGELADVAPRFGDGLRVALVIDQPEITDSAAVVVDDNGWRVESVEARLTDDDVVAAAQQLRSIANGLGASVAYLELPWADLPLDALSNAVRAARDAGAGIKLRCGGDTADAVPAPALVAAFVLACRDVGSQLKMTAGLHHPFRHPDAESGAMMHGFVNVVAAAAFAHNERVGEEELARLLSEEDETAFVIDGSRLAWRGHEATAEQVAAARRELLTAIGSCSFREPVDDLVAFGILSAP